MSKKEFEEFNLEKEIINRVEHLKMHEFNHNTNYEAYNNYFNKKLKLNYINKIYHHYSYINKSDYKIIDLTYNNCRLNLFHNIEGNGNIDNYHFYDTEFGMVGNNKYPSNACFLFGNLDTTTKSLNINYRNLSCNNGNLALYGFSIKNINIINYGKIVSFKGINLNNNHLLNQLLIDNIEIGELILENINNNFESFEIRNCKIDKLVIKNSNLGKAVFNGVEIGELEIENATLNDCIFNGVDFKIYELTEIKKENSVNYKIMKDNYRQLKHVMDKNANYTEANEFYALEMDYLRKLYSETNKFPIKDIKNDNYYSKEIGSYGTKLILISLKIINNYGTNWLINIFFLVMLSTVFSVGKFFYNDYERSGMTISQTFTELGMLHQENLDLFGVIGNGVTFLSYFLLLFIFGGIIFAGYKNMILGIILYIAFLGFFINQEIFTNFINLLLNPAYGLNMIPEINDNIGLLFLLIYKIIYGILIYQLIIALKRTTRR